MNWANVVYFQPHEFVCRGASCCGHVERMDEDLVLRLDDMRKHWGRPIRVTSGYRCPEHNAAVSSTGRTGPHTTGRAVDIAVSGRDAFVLIRMALERGFTGIGVSQKGPHQQRFLHLDTLPDSPHTPRPWVWSYP